MKSILALTLLISIPGLLLNAQDKTGRNRENQEKFRSMKIAFFTERLEFTPEEAEKFWPIYNEFEKKKASLRGEHRKLIKSYGLEAETMTDERAKEMIDQHIEIQKKETQLAVGFYAQIQKVLPAKKIMKLYITEVQFREYMLRQLRGERNGPGGESREKH